jgi:hypothetical protein
LSIGAGSGVAGGGEATATAKIEELAVAKLASPL